MASSTHNPSILLKRVLCLTESSPLILCLDSVAQTSNRLIDEIVHNVKSNPDIPIIYASFETINKPEYATYFIDVGTVGVAKIPSTINSYLPSNQQPVTTKYLIIIDSLNNIPNTELAQFMSSLLSPHSTVVVTYHKDMPEVHIQEYEHYPSSLELLQFMATTILDVNPILQPSLDEELVKHELERFAIPKGLNNLLFSLILTNRRKSGRSLSYEFHIDPKTHTYDVIKDTTNEEIENNENPEMLQDLTTFNLSTSAKQKRAKEQVDLPYLEAQSFNSGGAIVYEFEKDDDYDEDDPFEDPF